MAGYIGSKASVVSSGAERKKVFDITTTTTSLTGLSYTPNQVHVFHNGVRLVDGTDYTATNGTSITLTTAAENGDQVVVISYATFQPADAYTKAVSDDRFVNATGDTMTGALTVSASGQIFESRNADTYSRFTAPNGSAQLGLFRSGEAAGGFYIGGDNSNFRIYDSGFTARVLVNTSGHVTMPFQPTMHARLVATTTFGANAIFVPTQVNVNVGNHYSSSNGLFTAPTTGVYQLSASLLVRGAGSTSSYLSARPRINGTAVETYGAIYQAAFSTENNCAGIFQIPLSANDTLGLVLGAGGTIELYAQENFMSIRLLG